MAKHSLMGPAGERPNRPTAQRDVASGPSSPAKAPLSGSSSSALSTMATPLAGASRDRFAPKPSAASEARRADRSTAGASNAERLSTPARASHAGPVRACWRALSTPGVVPPWLLRRRKLLTLALGKSPGVSTSALGAAPCLDWTAAPGRPVVMNDPRVRMPWPGTPRSTRRRDGVSPAARAARASAIDLLRCGGPILSGVRGFRGGGAAAAAGLPPLSRSSRLITADSSPSSAAASGCSGPVRSTESAGTAGRAGLDDSHVVSSPGLLRRPPASSSPSENDADDDDGDDFDPGKRRPLLSWNSASSSTCSDGDDG